MPADLHLTETQDGLHVVTLAGGEILRTRSRTAAAKRFNELRREAELKYPARELTQEQKEEIRKNAMLDAMLGHNSLGGRKKKTTAGGTRTFGG